MKMMIDKEVEVLYRLKEIGNSKEMKNEKEAVLIVVVSKPLNETAVVGSE